MKFSGLAHDIFMRHVIAGNLNIIPEARVSNIISKGPKYRFPSNIDIPQCRREILLH